MNSKAARTRRKALSKLSDSSSQGRVMVGAPKGSLPLPRNVCQKQTPNRHHSSMVLPLMTSEALYCLKANGLSESAPSYGIAEISGKNSSPSCQANLGEDPSSSSTVGANDDMIIDPKIRSDRRMVGGMERPMDFGDWGHIHIHWCTAFIIWRNLVPRVVKKRSRTQENVHM